MTGGPSPANELLAAADRVREQHGSDDPKRRRFWYELAEWLDGCAWEYECSETADFSLVPDPALAFARAVLGTHAPVPGAVADPATADMSPGETAAYRVAALIGLKGQGGQLVTPADIRRLITAYLGAGPSLLARDAVRMQGPGGVVVWRDPAGVTGLEIGGQRAAVADWQDLQDALTAVLAEPGGVSPQ